MMWKNVPGRLLTPESMAGKIKQQHSTNTPTATRRKRGLREKCKRHGQQNNVALSGEKTHNSWSEVICRCTTLPCMAGRGEKPKPGISDGILNLPKYQKACDEGELATAALFAPPMQS